MTWVHVVAGLVGLFVFMSVVVGYACLVVAGREDDRMGSR